MKRAGAALAVFLALRAPGALAMPPVSPHGFVDLRGVAISDEESWTSGGLGKTRYGDGDDALQVGSGALDLRWQPLADLMTFADLRVQTTERPELSVLEAYARYRPVSTTPWRWSVKAGAFFPGVSVENDALGWSSPWTISSSAINTWVGEELRDVGGEFRLERRADWWTLEAAAAAFVSDDTAGELLAARGWSIGDLVYGLGSRTREPNIYARDIGEAAPRRYDPFQEIDDRIGWHAEVTWRAPQYGRLTVLRYDNEADPSQEGRGDVYAWRTRFWSVAGQTQFGALELIAQGMTGSTTIAPPGFHSETYFDSVFLLAGWDLGAWRPAIRLEGFATHTEPASDTAEHGNAVTLALNWRARTWLRLAVEGLRIQSSRAQREEEGHGERAVDTQVQAVARVLF